MPIAGMSTASTLNGNSRANLLFLSDLIGLRALDAPLHPAHPVPEVVVAEQQKRLPN